MVSMSIHSYASSGNLEGLIDSLKDTDVNVTNPFGWTALHIACWKGHYDIVNRLINEPGVTINVKDNRGRSPRDVAVSNRHPSIVILLSSFAV
jgi:ankyrin repeat protein